MSSRTAKFVSAIFASLLAGIPLTTVSHSATGVADDCVSGPKGAPPQGGHWYYRIDRATKRHCWYVGDAKEKLSRAAPENSSPSTNPVSPQKNATTQRSMADARAELPLSQTRVAQETSVTAWQPVPATSTNAAGLENSQRANPWDANTQISAVASRWPELSGASSSTSEGPTTGNSEAIVQSNSEAAPPPPVAAVTLAAADSSSEKQSGSIQMLLIVIVGALALAGIMGAAVFRFGSMRWTGGREIRADRRAIWDLADTDRLSPAAYTRADVSMPRVDLPRELRAADDPNGRIAEMIARLSRSAAA